MKYLLISLPFVVVLNLLSSCTKDETIDNIKPVISLTEKDAFPINCDTLYFGEDFTLRVLFTDNVELGSYSIDIHHNFDHHTHSTEVDDCKISEKKSPVNPFIIIKDFTIPSGKKEYQTTTKISIPLSNTVGLFDEGDYHLYINLTDKEGWSVPKGISIKMLHR